jgi:hypothetical protein
LIFADLFAKWLLTLKLFVVVAAAFADASRLRLDSYMSLHSTTSKLSMKTHCSLIFALLKQISPWKRGMISYSRILAANSLMLKESSRTHLHCCFASPSSRRPFSNGTETASPPASPGRPAPTRWSMAGLLAIQSLLSRSQRSRTVSPRKTRSHFQQFGRVTRAVRGHDRFFKNAYNGIVHLSITITPGFTLPHFVEVVDDNGAIATRLYVHTDNHRRRCARCGHTGHVGQFCKAGSCAAGADVALWSVLRIPPALLPQPAEDMDNENEDAKPAQTEGPPLTDWAADVEVEVIPSTPSLSSMDAGGGGVAGTPAAADQAAASPEAAPAPGAAASTVDLTPSPLSPSPSLPPLLLQLSGSSVSVASMPLGQGRPASTLDDASAVSLPTSSPSPSPISSLLSSSQRSERSRSPRPRDLLP